MERTPYNVIKAWVVFLFMLACMIPCVIALVFTKLGSLTGIPALVNLHREYSHNKTLSKFVRWGGEDLEKLNLLRK